MHKIFTKQVMYWTGCTNLVKISSNFKGYNYLCYRVFSVYEYSVSYRKCDLRGKGVICSYRIIVGLYVLLSLLLKQTQFYFLLNIS